MHSNVSTKFTPAPVILPDMNKTDQQQIQSKLLNLNSIAEVGLAASKPTKISTKNPNTDENQSSQQQHPISVENLYKTISLREKNINQLESIRQISKRLSDSILIPPYHHQQQLSLIAQTQSRSQQQIPFNVNHQHDQNSNTLNRHRLSYFQKQITNLQTIPQQSSSINEYKSQKMFVIRHGERVDTTFGANWLDQVYDKTTGIYHRINLNLPKRMVQRKDIRDFLFDPPLTELGLHQCKIVGEELLAEGIKIDHVYSSPALRCIQTADKILEGLQLREKKSIRIEPCLFEFLKWYPVVPVKWPFLEFDELTQNGYNIDKSYKPFYPIESLRTDENELMFYSRSHLIITSILKNHEIDGGNLLIVGHAPTIEVCTRQLTGGQPRINDLKFLVLRVPFLSMHCIAKQIDGTWKATKPPISPNKHAAVEPFDWRFFR